MHVLLDECLPQQLAKELQGHEGRTVPEMGWASLENGALLRLASKQFDAFLTVDRNLSYQQNVGDFDIGLIALIAPGNRLDDLRPLMPEVRQVLPTLQPGQVVLVGA